MKNKEKSYLYFGGMFGMMGAVLLHLILEQQNYNGIYIISLLVPCFIAAHFYKKYQTLKDEN